MNISDVLDLFLRSLLHELSRDKDGRSKDQSHVEPNNGVQRIDHVMQNSLGVLRMAVAFVSLNHRGREQQQGGSNQTSWHFKINSETSLEN